MPAQETDRMARYPGIRVSIRSSNPLALVAAVRMELRRHRVDREEISRFSDEAMSQAWDEDRLRQFSLQWIGTVIVPVGPVDELRTGRRLRSSRSAG